MHYYTPRVKRVSEWDVGDRRIQGFKHNAYPCGGDGHAAAAAILRRWSSIPLRYNTKRAPVRASCPPYTQTHSPLASNRVLCQCIHHAQPRVYFIERLWRLTGMTITAILLVCVCILFIAQRQCHLYFPGAAAAGGGAIRIYHITLIGHVDHALPRLSITMLETAATCSFQYGGSWEKLIARLEHRI